MNILITGAAGFIGQLLAEALLRETEQHNLLLTDVIDPPVPVPVPVPAGGEDHDQRIQSVKADLCSAADTVVDGSLDVVYILHGIMSSGSEEDLELGMRVNVDATRALLDAVRRRCRPGMVRVIYASSQAVYGRPLPDVVHEGVRPTPESSYGAEKLMCETMISDYTRRGLIDGFCLRFPTVCIRPGKPTAAASSFISGIIREPMQSKESVIPLDDRSFSSWVCSPRTLAVNLVHTLKLPSSSLPRNDRSINMPGIGVTIQQMMDALEKVGGREKLDLVKVTQDPKQEKILRSWPTKFDNSLAYTLKYQRDPGFEQAVIEYKESLI
jgi:nucleoside-diphosphate-sugar epimerase